MTKKDLFIADTTITIRDTKDYPIEDGMIEKLDDMLNEHGVSHFFTLPIDSTDGIANNDNDCLNLFYDSKDKLTFDLIYALWLKSIRKVNDEKIYEGLSRMCAA